MSKTTPKKNQHQSRLKPKPSFWSYSSGPIAVAHRGGGAGFGKDKHRKENTVAAFEAAVKLGYEYLEMDVIYTADERVIVIHVAKNQFEAAQLNKEAPNYQSLQSLTHNQIKDLFNREVPTLSEVLKAFPKAKLFVDAKTDKVVEPLVKVIIKDKHRIAVGSFYPERVIKLQQLLGEGAHTGLNISRSPLHLFHQFRALKRPELKNRLEALGLPYLFANSAVITHLHKKGFKVLVWTPNTHKTITNTVRFGADGIISDNVKLLKEILETDK